MNQNNYTLGIDLGITSIGWSLLDLENNNVVDMGVSVFDEAKQAKVARGYRNARRTLRRKKWRKEQLKEAFHDFHVLNENEVCKEGFLSFTTNNEWFKRPEEETVYHLRKKGLHEKISKRELFLCLYNILQARGNFLNETIDFENSKSLDVKRFIQEFYEVINSVCHIDNLVVFEKEVLTKLYKGHLSLKDIKNTFKENIFCEVEDEQKLLMEIIKLLSSYKADLSSWYGDEYNIKMDDLVKKEEITIEFIKKLMNLYFILKTSKTLSNHQYLCELHVQELERVKEIYSLEKNDEALYKTETKKIKDKMSVAKGNRLRVVKNLHNVYPNGLYTKEARSILKQQQNHYPEITDEFIDVCISIIKAKIPYFVGPLSERAKNAWLVKNGNIKYSYEYALKHGCVNELETIKKWKERMISRCTYFPDEYALPKGSFIGETFNIVNELNILQAEDKHGNQYYLTYEDKVKVFNELFLKKEKVKFKDIVDCLQLKSFKTKSGAEKEFNSRYTMYFKIKKVVKELEIDTIEMIFKDENKVKEIEKIILDLSIYDDEKSKFDNFKQYKNLSEDYAKALSKLNTTGFLNYSLKLINEIKINKDHETMLEALFNNNRKDITNEQMTLINEACDEKGNLLNLESNKYIARLEKHNALDINLLLPKGETKALIPMSRAVIRTVNEFFKLYGEILKTYGEVDRIVIETARDFSDNTVKKSKPKKKEEELKILYESLIKQYEENNSKVFNKSQLETWEEIKNYLQKNQQAIELYLRQNACDLLTGEKISLANLQDYEVDHILPRGFGDNSFDNLMLTKRIYNAKKSNRVPLEYINSGELVDVHGKTVIASDFVERCKELHELKLISDKKLKQLMLENTEEAMDFINRNLVDTRYIIREIMAILQAYHKVNNMNTKIIALKAWIIAIYRQALGFEKHRDYGVQHHAYDASVAAITDKVLDYHFPAYSFRRNEYYQNFLKNLNDASKHKSYGRNSKNDYLIQYLYQKTFNENYIDYESLVYKIKSTVPLYAIKVNKNYKGELFNATLYSPKKEDDTSVLSLMKINNEERNFSGINCVAVDFYKVNDGKGNRKTVGIQIPKFIVDSKGNINKDAYIKLIKEYYRFPELIDKNNQLKEYYFRFRAYNNDLIYDTDTQQIQLFLTGSLKGKTIELKDFDIFSHYQLYGIRDKFKNDIIDKYNLKVKENRFENLELKTLIEDAKQFLKNYGDVDAFLHVDKYIDARVKKKTLSEFSMIVAYLSFRIQKINSDFNLNENRKRPGIKNLLRGNAEYIKLKYSPLGFRFKKNKHGKLEIHGPNQHLNKFSKIRKEKFYWTL
ncbi:type II CRISPR RNA-guided endonuclease Cas9 [Erysipelotrichaceae bacterium OH741_COT-311]|nr:type II CRISPR RNA-guided endonuclease Cas9 [Erysipelotrichaceae bacterium OH741_COT-311]